MNLENMQWKQDNAQCSKYTLPGNMYNSALCTKLGYAEHKPVPLAWQARCTEYPLLAHYYGHPPLSPTDAVSADPHTQREAICAVVVLFLDHKQSTICVTLEDDW